MTYKRKLFSLLLIITLALMIFGGCAKRSEDVTSSEEAQDIDPGSEDSEGSQDGEDEEASLEETDPETKENMLWVYGSDIVYMVDDEGNMLEKYDLSAIRKKAKDESISLETYAFRGAADGILYFEESGLLPGYDHTYGKMLYAVDADTCESLILWMTEDSSDDYVLMAKVYNGDFYTAVKQDGVLTELRYSKIPGEMGFESFVGEYQDLLDAAGENDWSLYTTDGFTNRGCYTETIDKVGFLIAYDSAENRYMKLYPDGGAKVLEGMPDEYTGIYGFDEDYIIYNESNWETETSTIYCYDCRKEEPKEVLPFDSYEDDIAIYSYLDGKLYMKLDMGNEFGHAQYVVYTYTPDSFEWKEICSYEEVPGAKSLSADDDGNFAVIGGSEYIAGLDGDQLVWMKIESGKDEAVLTDIGCPIDEVSTLKYGSVDYVSFEDHCQNCGIPLFKYYQECFSLNPKYSPYADKINAYMKEEFDTTTEANRPSTEETDPDDDLCEDHLSFPRMYCETYEGSVDSVEIMHDKYLLVNKSGYWYGGGAHGYPDRGQDLFDLNTGNVLGIKDFYKGSEEEFKKLCADKTIEDFNSYDEYSNPYYTDSSDEIYEQAYNEAGFETSLVEFRDDGVYIYYMPYDMGPYSSGFIEIKILDADVY